MYLSYDCISFKKYAGPIAGAGDWRKLMAPAFVTTTESRIWENSLLNPISAAGVARSLRAKIFFVGNSERL